MFALLVAARIASLHGTKWTVHGAKGIRES